jgi:DNA-directed RNA polymerase specialized sigma24 family protein
LLAWIRKANRDSKLTAGAHRPSDILQQFFLRLLRKKANAQTAATQVTDPYESPESYFQVGLRNEGKTMRKAALAKKRGGGRKAATSTSFFTRMAGDADRPSQIAIANEFRQRFQAALDARSQEERSFFRRCLTRISWAEVGELFDLSEGAARLKFSRMAVAMLESANLP